MVEISDEVVKSLSKITNNYHARRKVAASIIEVCPSAVNAKVGQLNQPLGLDWLVILVGGDTAAYYWQQSMHNASRYELLAAS